MAFPTSPSNNQVHKEGNRSFVYDSALGTWDRVKEPEKGGFMAKGTELGTITGGEWHGTQISQCQTKQIVFSGDVGNNSTEHYLWQPTNAGRMNIVMKTTAPTIAYVASSSECHMAGTGQYSYWRMNAQRGTNSLANYPRSAGSSLVTSDAAIWYSRYTDNQSFNITINGTIALTNCKAGETWCFAPSFARRSGSNGALYCNYIGGNGRANVTIWELG